MTYLFLAIAFSTGNHLLFKAFARYRIDLLGAITANYLCCVVIGYGSSFRSTLGSSLFAQDWYLLSLVQGATLVGSFFLIGLTTAKHGVAPASLATRLSVVIPTTAAFFLYGDLLTSTKIIGVLAAVLALYLSSADATGSGSATRRWGTLPAALFAAFGIHSTLIKFVQDRFLDDTSYHAFVMSSFLSAFVISASILVWRLLSKRRRCTRRDLLSGLVLGCTNYCAVYFLIRVLGVAGWQSSQLFPTISIVVVSCSSFGAWTIFGESTSRRMLTALAVGAIAIVLVNL